MYVYLSIFLNKIGSLPIAIISLVISIGKHLSGSLLLFLCFHIVVIVCGSRSVFSLSLLWLFVDLLRFFEAIFRVLLLFLVNFFGRIAGREVGSGGAHVVEFKGRLRVLWLLQERKYLPLFFSATQYEGASMTGFDPPHSFFPSKFCLFVEPSDALELLGHDLPVLVFCIVFIANNQGTRLANTEYSKLNNPNGKQKFFHAILREKWRERASGVFRYDHYG